MGHTAKVKDESTICIGMRNNGAFHQCFPEICATMTLYIYICICTMTLFMHTN